MAAILTQAQQEEFLLDLEAGPLDNFSMAALLFEAMIPYGAANLPYPTATVLLRGQGAPVTIQGANCGLFVTPVGTMAGIDCRRSLEFFGLKLDNTTNSLAPLRNRRKDDVGIESFGLSQVSRQQFIQAVGPTSNQQVEQVLVKVHRWTDKQVAHFTAAPNQASLQAIREASNFMIKAYMCLLYDALRRPRPKLNPSN
jgi:hypothetical protein